MKKMFISFLLTMALFAAIIPVSAQSYTFSDLTVNSNLQKYDGIVSGESSDGFAVVVKDVDGDGLIDSSGKEVIPPKYDSMGKVVDGMAMITVNESNEKKYGFVNAKGEEVVPPIYDKAENFSEGLAVVAKISHYTEVGIFQVPVYKYGFVDKTGQEVIPLIYDSVSGIYEHNDDVLMVWGAWSRLKFGFSDGVASVEKDGKWGVIDKQGNVLAPFVHENLRGFSEGLAPVEVGNKRDTIAAEQQYTGTVPAEGGGKWGYVNKQGTVVIPAVYDSVNEFSEGLAVVGKKSANAKNESGMLYGAINQRGEVVVPIIYDSMGPFREGRSLVGKVDDTTYFGWRRGYVDTSGNLVIPMIYPTAHYFSEGLAKVGIESATSNKEFIYGYIDKQGNVVVPLKYESANSFSEGLARVGVKDGKYTKYGYIDKTGKEVIPLGTNQSTPTVPTESKPSTPDQSTSTRFADVPTNAYYSEAVSWAVKKEITSGTSNTTFSPDATCTTAQILTFLWRSQGEPEPTTKNPFADISENDYFYKAALWASEKGLLSGSTFGGNTPCTRAATVTYLWKLAGSPSAPAVSFSDVPSDADYAQAVAFAVNAGITAGTSAITFSPEATCTRGQIVTFLYQAYKG